ncbi:MAG: hypothetical protein JST86_07620 [Bacteroidetes bacterium]|nr:hypothetical protein [Bacteroidota bacterium]
MNNHSFVKVSLIANNAGVQAFEPRKLILNVSSIIALNERAANSFEVIVNLQTFKELEAKFYGRNTTLKEITATANDLKELL